MTTPLAVAFGSICKGRRLELDITQAVVAEALATSRGHYAMIEAGRVNPSATTMDRIAEALGIRLTLGSTAVVVTTHRGARDRGHARCSAATARRLRTDGWLVRREVEIRDGRLHGWIDLVAYHPGTRTLLLIEIKTSIDDVGRLERQVGWYERAVLSAIPAEWQPDRIGTWVLALATEEVDETLLAHRALFADAFPQRATEMRAVLAGEAEVVGRGIALIDPRSRRRDWLIALRVDGRRSPAPYQDRATALRLLSG